MSFWGFLYVLPFLAIGCITDVSANPQPKELPSLVRPCSFWYNNGTAMPTDSCFTFNLDQAKEVCGDTIGVQVVYNQQCFKEQDSGKCSVDLTTDANTKKSYKIECVTKATDSFVGDRKTECSCLTK